MEVLLHLHQTLAANPQAVLQSLPHFSKGMVYYLRVPDPARTDLLHEFVFQVTYHSDEQHIDVLRGSYWRHIGGLPDG